jgi:hypothetical protein
MFNFKLKPTTKNLITIDGGNTSMKYLTPDNKIGIAKTASIKLEKPEIEITKVEKEKDYFVKVEKLVRDKYKDLGTFLFGHAAVANSNYRKVPLGNEKCKDLNSILQIVVLAIDNSRRTEGIELRTMLPYTQIHYKDQFRKNLLGRYRITFLNRKEIIENEISEVKIAVEGSKSLNIEVDRLLSSKEIQDGSASHYARKIIAMFDIGGGQTDIPAVIIEKDSYGGYFTKKIQSFSTNFGMHYIATLLLQRLEQKNITTTTDEVISSIINYENKILLPEGSEYNFTKDLSGAALKGFNDILEKYTDNLRALNIHSQIGLIYLSGGGAITFSKAINKALRSNNKIYNFEIRAVLEPIHHNVLSLRGED